MKNMKRTLLTSAVSLILCFAMLLGTTLAWFTDAVTSGNNIIQSGNLDVEMYWADTLLEVNSPDWKNTEDDEYNTVFTYDNWEPGYTDVKYIKIQNKGSLSFKWQLGIEAEGRVTKLADVIDVYYINPVSSAVGSLEGKTSAGTLTNVLGNNTNTSGVLLANGQVEEGVATGEVILAIAMHMQDDAGNEYQGLGIGSGFSLSLIAAQYTYEGDSFGNGYDSESSWPEDVIVGSETASVNVDVVDGKVVSEANMTSETGDVTAKIPAGVALKPGVSNLSLSISDVAQSNANITLSETEATLSMDVHIEGVDANNEVAMEIGIKALLPLGLNMGNYRFYHVENGETVEMTLLQDGETPTHNNYEYDPVTGDVVLYLKSFSEVALVADTVNAWDGNFDYTWYTKDTNASVFTIANADQLAAFGKIVGGMATEITVPTETKRDPFDGKTVKLIADINLGGDVKLDNGDTKNIFHPIGYYFNPDNNGDKTNVAYSTVYNFKGTFDGNGNTISNIYQNTWEIKGDYNSGYPAGSNYYKDGFGLFGYVNGGTVKNLTVDNFSSDGEFTPTGVVAAYAANATFENIAITNSNPRVYNTGNGGIVGIGGNNSDTESNKLTFKNITVDNTNKISALWGSWDVACGGMMGMFRGNGKVKFINCHVAAHMDVNNDVCANYQYYWYRYSGMFIGSIRKNTKDSNGYTVGDTTGITAENCTYTIGEWNQYWYCELVSNSLASYTHDYQFSRLTNIKEVSEIQDASGNWIKKGNFVISNGTSAECYHIVENEDGTLKRHLHEDAGTQIINDVEILVEDRTLYCMPFNQLMNGDGYGVKAHYEFAGMTEEKNGPVASYEKFANLGNVTTVKAGSTITLGQLVKLADNVDKSMLSVMSVFAAVSPKSVNDNVSAIYSLDKNNWENSQITFAEDSEGVAKIVITDYFYCTPTVIYVNVNNDHFTSNTVENAKAFNYISLGTLFNAKENANLDNVTVTIKVGSVTTEINGAFEEISIPLTKSGEWTVTLNDGTAYCNDAIVTFNVGSSDKFASKDLQIAGNKNAIVLKDLFIDLSKDFDLTSVDVSVSGVNATFSPDDEDWENGTIKFEGVGIATITISSTDGANALTIEVEVCDAENIYTSTGTDTEIEDFGGIWEV